MFAKISILFLLFISLFAGCTFNPSLNSSKSSESPFESSSESSVISSSINSSESSGITISYGKGLTLHFRKPDGWANPLIYYYNVNPPELSTIYWAQSPAMISEGNGWFYYTITNSVSASIKFQDGYKQFPQINGQGFFRSQSGWLDIDGIWYNQDPDLNNGFDASQNGRLIISEVGSTYSIFGSPWVEVYNPTTKAVLLSNYKLRCWSINRINPFNSTGIKTFNLLPVLVQPGQYLLIRGKTFARYDNYDGYSPTNNFRQVVFVIQLPDSIPYWSESGFIELVNNGTTSDFVRFGSDRTPPVSLKAWGDSNAPGLPNSSNTYGSSIGRNIQSADNNSYLDWILYNFATPGGPNDLTFNDDIDNDGIPDCSEIPGGAFAGLPLYNWGARTNQKDIFIHIDYMDSTDPGVIPRKESLDKVVKVFSKHGYSVHFDVGDLYDSEPNPSLFNLDNRGHRVPFSLSIGLSWNSGTDFFNYKNQYMPIAKKQIFHYLLMAFSQNVYGSGGSSGIAELPGNDIIITLGNWGLRNSNPLVLLQLINWQATTIMHELGHNLGLRHGGNDDINYKPNYFSIMNYMYQIYGLPVIGSSKEGDRYYYYRWESIDQFSVSSSFKYYFPHGGWGDMTNSPITTNFNFDYSLGLGSTLSQFSIDETKGLGQTGSGGVDFNGNYNKTDKDFSMNLNPFDNTNFTSYDDFNDWAAISLFFQRTYFGDISGDNNPDRLKSGIRSNNTIFSPDDYGNFVTETLMPTLRIDNLLTISN